MKAITLAILIMAQYSFAQTQERLKVFMDCPSCDMEYLKVEIQFADFVRDRKVSDIQLKVQINYLANGDEEIEMRTFKDSKKCESSFKRILEVGSSENQRRTLIKEMITIASLTHITNTDQLANFSIQYNAPEAETEQPIDPWRNWTFNARVYGWSNGQSNYQSTSTYSTFTAQKVTELNRILFRLNQNQRHQSFVYGEEQIKSKNVSNNANFEYTGAINNRWSYGCFINAHSSTYNNIEYNYSIASAIEFNFFDYKDYNDKVLKLDYRIISKYNNYIERTVYGKDEEHLLAQSLGLVMALNKNWGSINSSIYTNSYFHDPKLYSVRIWNGVDWNIAKGLALNFSMSFSIMQDQIELVGSDLSREDVLLSQKKQATNYDYWTNVGLSYTFGSIYNNIVNQRFQ